MTTKTVGFIPCNTKLIAVFVLEDGSTWRTIVHAFEVIHETFSEFDTMYLNPLIITDRTCLDSVYDENFVGLFDETDTKENIDDCIKKKLEELKEKRKAVP